MELVWNALALPGLLVGAIELALAALIQTTRPGIAQNTRLAIALVFNAFANAAYSFRLLLVDPADGYAILFVFMPCAIMGSAAIALFIGTFATPLAAPLRSRAAPYVVGGIAVGCIVALFVRPSLYIVGMRPFPHTTGFEFANGQLWNSFGVVLAATLLYGLVCAVDAWRRASPGISRKRAGTFAVGFGVQAGADAIIILYLTNVGDLNALVPTLVNFVSQAFTALFLACTIAYGILRFQLLEIDLRIKRSIRRGALAALFVATFFAATELAQVFLSETVGPVIGVIAAAALAFFLHPLQRIADRVAETAMPGVQATPQYLTYRRLEIYREAYEGLLADGSVTPKERATLDRLRAKLGIAEADAAALESASHADPTTLPV